LNVGLTDVSVGGLAQTTGNEPFAYDCYRRLIEMYGERGDGVHFGRFEANDDPKEAIDGLRATYKEQTGSDFPQDPREQLRRAIVAAFDSWQSARAYAYRRMYYIPHARV